ncbi:MAG: GTPase domain-containing protein [Nitrospirae bacterium]|nr:GTPase domain-containing protein [Nitrospirota bacterium]
MNYLSDLLRYLLLTTRKIYSNAPFIITLLSIGTSAVFALYFFGNTIGSIDNISIIIFISSLILLMLSVVASLTQILNRDLPVAYRVAIVGFPKSGKTTLITSLFGEIFAQRVLGVNAIPTGQSTIERVNADLAKLAKGQNLGPTTDQDLFAYRTNIRLKTFPFWSTYKIEFGDFPGEDSSEYIKNFGPWLHTTPFFKWMVDADAVVFVIDIGRYLDTNSRTGYVVETTAAIRAAWQNFVDYADSGSRLAKRKRLILAFTKADLFDAEVDPLEQVLSNKKDERALNEAIARLGFGDQAPPLREINYYFLDRGRSDVKADYDDLLSFLRSQNPNFRMVFTSCFGTVKGVRLGIAELFKMVLPV